MSELSLNFLLFDTVCEMVIKDKRVFFSRANTIFCYFVSFANETNFRWFIDHSISIKPNIIRQFKQSVIDLKK